MEAEPWRKLRRKTLAELVEDATVAAKSIGDDIETETPWDPWAWASYERLRGALAALKERVGEPD